MLLCVLSACDVPGGALSTEDGGALDAPIDTSVDVTADAGGDAADAPEPVDAAADIGEMADAFDAGNDATDAGIDACTTDDPCNGVDDDCDGFIDEDGCTDCVRVEAAGVPSHVYLFCEDMKVGFDEAVERCGMRGYRLADVQTELEHRLVWMRAQSVRDDHWWIGLREEDGWHWRRGESAYPHDPTGYNGWMSGDPGDGEPCARMKKDSDGVEATFSDGGWETKVCTDNNYYVCEVGG